MLSIFNKTCCRCHENTSHSFIEFDSDHDPNVPGYVSADGTIRGGSASLEKQGSCHEHTLVSFPGTAVESDDTDGFSHDKRMTVAESELSKAWKEAEAMRNISYKLTDHDVDGTLPDMRSRSNGKQDVYALSQPIDANSDGILTYDEFRKGASSISGDPAQGRRLSAYDSNPNLRNIQDELERTRALLGLPARKLGSETPAVASNAPAPSRDLSMPAANGAPPSLDSFKAPLPGFGQQQAPPTDAPPFPARADAPSFSARYASSEASDHVSENQRHSDVLGASREEQKQKIKDEVAALRMRVRKAKNDMLASQGGGANLRASPRVGGLGADPSTRWGILDPSPREESRATREESRATTGTYISADVSTF